MSSDFSAFRNKLHPLSVHWYCILSSSTISYRFMPTSIKRMSLRILNKVGSQFRYRLLCRGTLAASVGAGARVMGWTCRGAGCRRSPSRWRKNLSSPGAPCRWAGGRGRVRGAAPRADHTRASEISRSQLTWRGGGCMTTTILHNIVNKTISCCSRLSQL